MMHCRTASFGIFQGHCHESGPVHQYRNEPAVADGMPSLPGKCGRLALIGIIAAIALTVPGEADAVSKTGMGFSGRVLPRGDIAIRIERSEIVAFGDIAGVRMISVNRTPDPVDLAYELKNDMSETIVGNWKETFQIPARSQMHAVVTIPLGEDASQKFTICAKHSGRGKSDTLSKCFPVVVNRLR
jgi:hypothetical protein